MTNARLSVALCSCVALSGCVASSAPCPAGFALVAVDPSPLAGSDASLLTWTVANTGYPAAVRILTTPPQEIGLTPRVNHAGRPEADSTNLRRLRG